jgi:hypothetical protein
LRPRCIKNTIGSHHMRQRAFAKQVPPFVERGWQFATCKRLLRTVIYFDNTAVTLR